MMKKPYMVNFGLLALMIVMMIIFQNFHFTRNNHIYIFSVIGVTFVILHSINKYFFSLNIVKKALKKEGLELIETKYQFTEAGPFKGAVSSGQAIFRIKVKDKGGRLVSGWACIGGYFMGVSLITRKIKLFLPAVYKDVDFKIIGL